MSPLKVLSIQAVKQTYKQARKSTVEEFDEWDELKAKLTAGLKGQEAVVITLKPDPKKPSHKNLRGTWKRHVRKYLQRARLDKEYTVRALRDGVSGDDVIIVSKQSPATSKRR